VAMIGYVLRFSPPIKLIKDIIEQGRIGRVLSIRTSVGQNLLNWRSGKRYQDTVSARKDLGGGVLLELSHELDYVRWFAGEVKEVSALTGKVSNLEVDVEDIADICLRFESGALGNIHLDMVDHAANRSCRVVGTKGTVIWHSDDDNSVSLYSEETGGWTEMYKTSVTDGNEKFRAELRHFFECIADSKMPLISIEDGRRVVEIVSAAKRSAETGETISL